MYESFTSTIESGERQEELHQTGFEAESLWNVNGEGTPTPSTGQSFSLPTLPNALIQYDPEAELRDRDSKIEALERQLLTVKEELQQQYRLVSEFQARRQALVHDLDQAKRHSVEMEKERNNVRQRLADVSASAKNVLIYCEKIKKKEKAVDAVKIAVEQELNETRAQLAAAKNEVKRLMAREDTGSSALRITESPNNSSDHCICSKLRTSLPSMTEAVLTSLLCRGLAARESKIDANTETYEVAICDSHSQTMEVYMNTVGVQTILTSALPPGVSLQELRNHRPQNQVLATEPLGYDRVFLPERKSFGSSISKQHNAATTHFPLLTGVNGDAEKVLLQLNDVLNGDDAQQEENSDLIANKMLLCTPTSQSKPELHVAGSETNDEIQTAEYYLEEKDAVARQGLAAKRLVTKPISKAVAKNLVTQLDNGTPFIPLPERISSSDSVFSELTCVASAEKLMLAALTETPGARRSLKRLQQSSQRAVESPADLSSHSPSTKPTSGPIISHSASTNEEMEAIPLSANEETSDNKTAKRLSLSHISTDVSQTKFPLPSAPESNTQSHAISGTAEKKSVPAKLDIRRASLPLSGLPETQFVDGSQSTKKRKVSHKEIVGGAIGEQSPEQFTATATEISNVSSAITSVGSSPMLTNLSEVSLPASAVVKDVVTLGQGFDNVSRHIERVGKVTSPTLSITPSPGIVSFYPLNRSALEPPNNGAPISGDIPKNDRPNNPGRTLATADPRNMSWSDEDSLFGGAMSDDSQRLEEGAIAESADTDNKEASTAPSITDLDAIAEELTAGLKPVRKSGPIGARRGGKVVVPGNRKKPARVYKRRTDLQQPLPTK